MGSPDAAELVEKLKPAFPGKHVAGIENIAQEEAGGVRLTLIEVTVSYTTGSGDKERTHWATQTAALYDSPNHRFPGFSLQPSHALMEMALRMAGIEDIDFASHAAFSKAYLLRATHPDRTRRLFDHPPLLDELGRRAGLTIGSDLSSLVLYRWEKQCDAAGRRAFAGEAAAIFRLFEEAALASQAKPAPKPDPSAFSESMPGELGKRLRKAFVTRADLAELLSQPAPRALAANVRASLTNATSRFFIPFGIFLMVFSMLYVALSYRSASWAQLIVPLLFGLAGLGAVVYLAIERLRTMQLLRHGALADARIEGLEATGASTNGVEDYLLRVRFQAGAQIVQAGCTVSGNARQRAKLLAIDKKRAPILYDPQNPQRILFADGLLSLSPEIEP